MPALSLRVVARDPWPYALAVFSIVYAIPAFRLIASLSDEGIILHGAARLLEGQILYRDFFEIIGPGTFVVSAAWLKAFGSSFAAVRVLSVATVTLIAVLIYLAARAVSAHRAIALGVALAFVVRAAQDLNHHWFTTVAAMAAALSVLISITSERLWLACASTGLFVGLATMFTQTRGVALALGIVAVLLTLPDRGRRLAWTVAGMTVAPAVAALYLARGGALRAAIDETLIFPSQRYGGIQAVPFGAFGSFADTAMVVFLPVTLLLALVTLGTEIRRRPEFRVALVLVFVAFVGAYPRPDVTHLTYVMPLATPMFALTLSAALGALGARSRLAVSAALIALCLWHAGSSVIGRISMALRPRQEIATARGNVERYQDFWARDLAWLVAGIQEHTRANDRFFFYPNMPLVPWLTARHHIARLDVMMPSYTTAEQYRDVCGRVMSEAQWVVIDRLWIEPAFLLSVHPAMADPNPPEKQAFEAALMKGFGRIAFSDTFEVRQRTAAAVPSLCDGVGGRNVALAARRR